MRNNSSRFNLALGWLAAGLVLLAGAAGAADPEPATAEAAAAATQTEDTREATAEDSSVAAAGLKVFVDPASGALVVPPRTKRLTLDRLSPEMREALSTSSDGLVEVTTPNGTVLVNLQGRFRSASIATVGADGEVTITHGVPVTPEAGDEAEETDDDR